MNSESNYYRIILETVWKYTKENLNTMTDEECEYELDFISNSL